MKALTDEEYFAIRKDHPMVGWVYRGTVTHIFDEMSDRALCGQELVELSTPPRKPELPHCERCVALARQS